MEKGAKAGAVKELFQLFAVFARIGAVTFGGGYAMLPILQREIVDKRGWAAEEELMDYFAIGQCTPGIIAVNTATFIGQKRRGILGGIFATLGVVFPSVIIVSIIAAFISNFSDIKIVKDAFVGIRAAVCVLIFNAIIKLWKKAVVDILTMIIFAAVFAGYIITGWTPIIFIAAAAIAGLAARGRKGGRTK